MFQIKKKGTCNAQSNSIPNSIASPGRPEVQEILTEQDPVQEALEHFFTEGLITGVLHVVKSGKEATVYCCQAHHSTGVELLAAKVYRSRSHRGFKNDAIYQEGRLIRDGHVRRAVQNKSRFGQIHPRVRHTA
jgi:serine/threonine-protein kinase RIO1